MVELGNRRVVLGRNGHPLHPLPPAQFQTLAKEGPSQPLSPARHQDLRLGTTLGPRSASLGCCPFPTPFEVQKLAVLRGLSGPVPTSESGGPKILWPLVRGRGSFCVPRVKVSL